MLLRLHSTGELVKQLQIKLNSLGFIIVNKGPGSAGQEVDIFCPLTDNAVRRYQAANNLKINGLVGSKTWASLLKNHESKVKPLYVEINKEDFSDPEEQMPVEDLIEESPTCPNVIELINLITNSEITRNVTRLVFHCTATNQNASVTSIQRYWREVLKWRNPGYHIIVKPDGSWTQLLDFNNVSNGVAGINSTSIHIAYIGGIDSKGKAFDNRTNEQKNIFETVFRLFSDKMPSLTFHGHNEFSNKACPSFNVKNWLKSID